MDKKYHWYDSSVPLVSAVGWQAATFTQVVTQERHFLFNYVMIMLLSIEEHTFVCFGAGRNTQDVPQFQSQGTIA